jgi:hypothetical protein
VSAFVDIGVRVGLLGCGFGVLGQRRASAPAFSLLRAAGVALWDDPGGGFAQPGECHLYSVVDLPAFDDPGIDHAGHEVDGVAAADPLFFADDLFYGGDVAGVIGELQCESLGVTGRDDLPVHLHPVCGDLALMVFLQQA